MLEDDAIDVLLIIDVRDNPDDAIDEQVEQERLDDDAAAWEAFFEEWSGIWDSI